MLIRHPSISCLLFIHLPADRYLLETHIYYTYTHTSYIFVFRLLTHANTAHYWYLSRQGQFKRYKRCQKEGRERKGTSLLQWGVRYLYIFLLCRFSSLVSPSYFHAPLGGRVTLTTSEIFSLQPHKPSYISRNKQPAEMYNANPYQFVFYYCRRRRFLLTFLRERNENFLFFTTPTETNLFNFQRIFKTCLMTATEVKCIYVKETFFHFNLKPFFNLPFSLSHFALKPKHQFPSDRSYEVDQMGVQFSTATS